MLVCKQSVLLYLGSFDMLGHFVKVAVELSQFGLHHISAGGPPAGHQDDGLVPHVVHTHTDVLQLLQHALRTDHTVADHLLYQFMLSVFLSQIG